MDTYEPDIVSDYNQHMRAYLLKYVLNDPYEWDRLKIQTFPAEYPTMVIRAPVPWHTQYNLSKQSLELHLYICNKVLRDIRDLWTKEFSMLLVAPTDRLDEGEPYPLEPTVFEAKIDEFCEESRFTLLNIWLLKCADIFLDNRNYWDQYIPKHPGDSLCIVEGFFACVNNLMSLQLRGLVKRSLRHFAELIIRYKVIAFLKKLVHPKKK